MKKIVCLFVISLLLCCFSFGNIVFSAHAESEEVEYIIYDENNIQINSAFDVVVGDMFISEDNVLYEIYFVDDNILSAYAKEISKVDLPKINDASVERIKTTNKRIGMYHTHNDESYVIGDGYDSIYGNGGIVDIGDAFASELKKYNIEVCKKDSLHLPHDSSAYSRSKKTAQNLINTYSLDAIFDVHRDGVPRSQFVGSVNGNEMSKIRMVVGKSNSNYQKNLDFALAIKAYADKNYPGLIKDIYMGKGHYNQALSRTAMLFEMGTYLIEKDFVYSSVPYLADCIDKVLYTSVVDGGEEEGGFREEIKDTQGTEVVLNEKPEINNSQKKAMIAFFVTFVGGVIVILTYKTFKKSKKKKRTH